MTATTGKPDFLAGGQRPSVFTLVSITIATSILSLALPVTTLQIYDRVLTNYSTNTLAILIIGVTTVIFLEILLRLAKAYLIGFFGAAHTHRISCAALDRVLKSDLGGNTRNLGHFHSLGAIRNLKDFANGHSLTTLVELLFVPVFLGLIAYIANWLVLVPAALLTVFALFSIINGYRLKKELTNRETCDDSRYSFLISNLNSVHSVKAFAREGFLLRRYEKLQHESGLANYAVSGAMTESLNISALFSQLMTAATVGFGALIVIDGQLTVGALIAVVLLSGRIMQPVQKGVMLWARYQDYKVSLEKVQQLFELRTLHDKPSEYIPVNGGNLTIEKLSFAYNKDLPPVLDDIRLTLSKGETISISGGQGSGKSTLLKIIAGLKQPTEGQVLINGLETHHFPPHLLNEQVGYMPTEGIIFRGTIRDNITRFGNIPARQALYVAELLGLDTELASLPAGLDTKLEGTGADSVPPGIKQRIALTRVLAARPRILLFDNADVALDLMGYTMIYRLLGRLKPKTAMIIVSEDENLRSLADKHFLLQDGKLFEITSGFGKDLLRPRDSRHIRL